MQKYASNIVTYANQIIEYSSNVLNIATNMLKHASDVYIYMCIYICIYVYIYIYICVYIYISQKWVHTSHICKYFIISFYITTMKKLHFSTM